MPSTQVRPDRRALAPACSRNRAKTPNVQTATVARRDIVIDAQANGAVEPINVVEVKSKASGLITKMPVETGTNVRPGQLLVQVDTRDVQNQYNQSDADVKAAKEAGFDAHLTKPADPRLIDEILSRRAKQQKAS